MVRDPVCLMGIDLREAEVVAVLDGPDETEPVTKRASNLGETITQHGLTLITGARVVYASDPVTLVKQLLAAYQVSLFRGPSCFCDETLPADS